MINPIFRTRFSNPLATWKFGLKFTVILIVVSFHLTAQAQNQRWYQVELIVFSRLIDDRQEHWPTNIKLGYPSNWVELRKSGTQDSHISSADVRGENPTPGFISSANDEAFVKLPESEKKLIRHANALKRDSRYRILFHEAWRQFVGGQRQAPAILINGGANYGNHSELEGSITLSVAQYLQLQTRLWLSQFELNQGQAPGEWPRLPGLPHQFTEEMSGDNQHQSSDAHSSAQDEGETATFSQMSSEANEPYLPKRIVLVEQSRRMRSKELHYIDHPVLGLIIQITPYEKR